MLQSAGMPYTVQSTTTIGTYPTPLQQQNQNTAKLRYVGYTMQTVVHGAPFASVTLRTSVQNVFRITLGCTAPHASNRSGEANTQWQLSLQQKGPSSHCDCRLQCICTIL